MVAEHTWLVGDVNLIAAKCLQSEVQSVCHIFRPHVGATLPRDKVASLFVQDRAKNHRRQCRG